MTAIKNGSDLKKKSLRFEHLTSLSLYRNAILSIHFITT